MSSVSFKITKDDISPALGQLARTAKNPTPIFRAMGTTFKSITEGNFNSVGAALRPKPWPAKKNRQPATLKKSGTLSTSFHLEVTAAYARLGNPTIYAAIHQFGAKGAVAGKKVGTTKTKYANRRFAGSFQDITEGGKGNPARPFYPVENGKLIPAAETLIARAGERALAREAASNS